MGTLFRQIELPRASASAFAEHEALGIGAVSSVSPPSALALQPRSDV